MPEFDRLEIAWKIDLCLNNKRTKSPNFIFQGLKFNLFFELQLREESGKDRFVLYMQGVDRQSVELKDFIINSYIRNTSGTTFFSSTKLVTHPLNPSCQIIWEINSLFFMSVYDDLVEMENDVEKIIINCSLRSGTQTSRLEKKPNIVCSGDSEGSNCWSAPCGASVQSRQVVEYQHSSAIHGNIAQAKIPAIGKKTGDPEGGNCSSPPCGALVQSRQVAEYQHSSTIHGNIAQAKMHAIGKKTGDPKEGNCSSPPCVAWVQSSQMAEYQRSLAIHGNIAQAKMPAIGKKTVFADFFQVFSSFCQTLLWNEIFQQDEEVNGDFEEASCVNYRESATYYKNREPDMVLTCKDVIFPAHKAILGARCKKFLKHIEELDTSEISDMHPSTLEYFLQYVYSGSLQCLSHESICLQLYDSGFKYGLMELARLCADRLVKGLAGGVTKNIFCEFLALVYKHEDENTKRKIMCDYNNLMLFLGSKEWSEYSKHNVDLSINLTETILLLQDIVSCPYPSEEEIYRKYFF